MKIQLKIYNILFYLPAPPKYPAWASVIRAINKMAAAQIIIVWQIQHKKRTNHVIIWNSFIHAVGLSGGAHRMNRNKKKLLWKTCNYRFYTFIVECWKLYFWTLYAQLLKAKTQMNVTIDMPQLFYSKFDKGKIVWTKLNHKIHIECARFSWTIAVHNR